MTEDLRRIDRVSVCCRVSVRDRYGMWTAVTEDICTHGCRIFTQRLLRAGSLLNVTLSSDLFPEELEAVSEAVWSTPDRLGIAFIEPIVRSGSLRPDAWLAKVLEHGATPGATTPGVVPVVRRMGARTPVRSVQVLRAVPSASADKAADALRRFPVRRA
jgi:hypothetical protein